MNEAEKKFWLEGMSTRFENLERNVEELNEDNKRIVRILYSTIIVWLVIMALVIFV